MGFMGIQPIAKKYGVDIIWRPIIVGGVFNQVNAGIYESREVMLGNPVRKEYYMKDMQDWARYQGLEIHWPDFHPANATRAMRGCFVAEEQGLLVEYSQKVCEAYWGRSEDIYRDDVLRGIIASLGMNETEFFEKISQPEYKEKLRANTDELVERNGFGSPTIIINDDDMYFGNDRLPLVEFALKQLAAAASQ